MKKNSVLLRKSFPESRRVLSCTIIIFIFVAMACGIEPTPCFGGNTSAQEYGDPVYRQMGYDYWEDLDHAALFAGISSDNKAKIIQVEDIFDCVRDGDLSTMSNKPGKQYWGAYNLNNRTLSFDDRYEIISTAITLKGENCYYSWGDCLNPIGGNIGSWISPSEVYSIRCDGLVEYCYEWKNFDVWGKNGSHYDVSNVSYYQEHNNLYGETWPHIGWPNDPDTELAPVVQRGAAGGTSTHMTQSALTDVPTYAVGQSQVGSTVYVTITATDQSGIHYIKYKKGSGGSYSSSPVQPQHPTSASYSYTVQVTSSTWLYYYAKDNGGNYPEYAESVWVYVPPTLSYITISGPTQVNENSGAQYTCTAYYSDGSNSNVTSSASWSENSSYATISSSGYLTTSSVSSDQPCTITASYGGKSDTHNVTIKNVPPTLSYITISGPTQVNENSGAQYTCTAYYSDGSNSNVTSSASWSENSSYATISSSGYLTTSSVSSDQPCTITASYGGKSDTHNVTIKNVPSTLSYITISGPTQVNENSGAQYTCTAYYSDGSNSNVTSSASWSENSSYATISSSGYLTTSSVSSDQPCTITASYGGKSDTHNVTIKNVPSTLSYITISGPTQVNENSGAQYTCTAYYSDGSNSNVTSSASWSENSAYASISNSGYLTTLSVPSDQSCIISASYGGKSDTHNVTIFFDYSPWTLGADVPDGGGAYTRWSYHGSCVSNDKIWLVAGRRDANWSVLDNVGTYDPVSDSWDTTYPNVNQGRVYLTAAGNDEYVFALGGRSPAADTIYSNVERLDVSNPTSWSNMTSLPSGRVFGTSVIEGGYLYYIGGSSDAAGYTKTTTLWRYDISGDTWNQTLQQIPTAMSYLSAAVVNGKIYVPGDSDTATTYVYDIAGDSWSTIAASGGIMPASHYACISVNNNIWRIGGIIDGAASDEVWVLDTQSNTWSLGSNLNVPRINFSAGVVGNRAAVAGGVGYPGWTPTMTTEYTDITGPSAGSALSAIYLLLLGD